ncbi:Hydrolase, alpha/beta fold family [hydrothermal vent metagenome]|uniref:Hydrolase, alpha/beta fold family n=1 Tax=hydrothermal vent metagenome TaxID=652676 RepID=A0A3B0YQ13_9ZZZZ
MTSFIIFIVLGLLLLNIWMYFQQPKMTFYPSRELDQTPANWGLDYEDVTLNTADKVQLHGWFIPSPQSQQVLLFFHGNGGNISHRRDSIEIFHRLGLNVFIIDYRGYGKSEGTPGEQGLYQDASGVQARGLILESTLSSTKDFAREVFPVLSRLVVTRYDFNTAEYIRHVNYPVLVLHSPEDDIMPFHLGEKVFRSAHEPKRFVRLRGGHNDGFLQSQPGYEQEIDRWLKTIDTGS